MSLSPAERALANVMKSPTRHLCTCASWTDDSGQMWAGTAARATMPPEQAERCLTPEANTLQLRIERAIAYAARIGIPARIIVLKGRRSGSSLICAKLFDLEAKKQKTQGLIMGDQFDRSDEIFAMTGQFATNDAVPWGFGAKVSDTKIKYGNGSLFRKDTALDPNAGRGAGNRLGWFSEAAHYPSDGVRDARRLMMATLNTIPQKVGTIVIVESTANGPDGFYAETWRAAEWPDDEDYFQKWEQRGDKKPENTWLRVFAAWFEIPRNAIPATKDEAEAIFGKLSKSERYGVDTYQWTAAQLKWRRYVVANNFSGDERRFDQEYPHSPDSAFLTTGSAAFNRDSLNVLRQRAMASVDKWMHGVIDHSGATAKDIINGDAREFSVRFRRTPKEEAWCALLEPPRDRCRYLFPVDPASEQATTDGSGDLDRMSCLMLRAGFREELRDGETIVDRSPRLVARLTPEVMDEHPTADQTTFMCALLSRLYGDPTIPVEVNKGEWVITAFKRAGLNLYRTQPSVRDRQQKLRPKFGWVTGEESRHTIIKGLQSAIHGTEFDAEDGKSVVRLPAIEVEDLFTVAELEHFVKSKKGRYEAASGKHDDDVLCLAMGLHLIEFATTYRAPTRKAR